MGRKSAHLFRIGRLIYPSAEVFFATQMSATVLSVRPVVCGAYALLKLHLVRFFIHKETVTLAFNLIEDAHAADREEEEREKAMLKEQEREAREMEKELREQEKQARREAGIVDQSAECATNIHASVRPKRRLCTFETGA